MILMEWHKKALRIKNAKLLKLRQKKITHINNGTFSKIQAYSDHISLSKKLIIELKDNI